MSDDRHELDRTLAPQPSPVRRVLARMQADEQAPEDDWLTTTEVAERVRRTPKTVLAWVHADPPKLVPDGRLPDGGYLFRRQTVVDFVRFGLSGAPSAQPRTERALDLEAHVTATMERARARRAAL